MNDHHANTFFAQLYESFVRIRGVPVALISLVLGIVYFLLSNNTASIQLKLILPVLVVLLLAIVTLFDMASRLFSKATHLLPRVKQACKPPSVYPGAIAILLLENSDIYGHESMVSIYYIDGEFEVLIGLGFVLTRQNDGLIQVLVSDQIEASYADVWDKVCQNDAKVLPRLLVKPSVPKLFSEGAKL